MAKETATQKILRVVEPFVYGRPKLMMGILVALTLFFLYHAANIKPDAGFEKSIPLKHPYMQTLQQYKNDFGGGNLIKIALIQEEGEIYNEEFLTKLREVTDEVFFLDGIDRSRVSSLFTPDVRYTEVVEGGFSGGNVIPAEYAPNEEMFRLIKSNVGKAGIIGRLVTEDQSGAMVNGELLEFDPVTGEKADYRRIAKQLEEIRQKYETDDIKIHIIGFAKVVGDVTDATLVVVGFFLLTLLMTLILLWIYTGSFKLALLPLIVSIVAVIWEFGLLRLCGFGLDPFAILVPFLVLSVSVSHGVQYVNAWVAEVAYNNRSSFDASLESFRRLAIPGTTALITDTAGFLTILLIPIAIIQEMSFNAAFGIAAIIVTNKIMMPIWLTWITIGDKEEFKRKQEVRERFGDGLWRLIAKNTRTVPATITLLICGLLLGWSLWKYPELQVGDSQEGVPELRPDSRYNQDSRAIVNNFTIGVDVLKVIAETKASACIQYEQMESIERFAWHMENLEKEVQSVISLPQLARTINAGFNEGALKWRVLSRNSSVMSQATTPVETSTGLLNPDCSAMPVLIFTKDHKAKTIKNITDAVKEFNAAEAESYYATHPEVDAEYCNAKQAARDSLGMLTLERENIAKKAAADTQASDKVKAQRQARIEELNTEIADAETAYAEKEKTCPVNFALASGNVGVMAATNEVVKAQEIQVVAIVYVVVVIFLFLSFWSLAGVFCVVLPLSLVSVMAYAVMAQLGIGLKVATLPVVALAVGIGVDYGIYVFAQLAEGVAKGQSNEEAFYNTLKQSGKAVIFTGVTLGLGVFTWLFSALQFQADMGILLVFMFTANMFGAILVMPALARFMLTKEAAMKSGVSAH